MLNYIWLSLIIIGIVVAVGLDVNDLSTNRYHNGEETEVVIHLASPDLHLRAGDKTPVTLELEPKPFEAKSDSETRMPVIQKGELVWNTDSTGVITLSLDDHTPLLWMDIARAQKKEGLIAYARYHRVNSTDLRGALRFDPVRFTKLNSVTNDGIIKYAKTAVELAIGLIGVMALWLGLMKIAEQSGLVANLARVLKPVTTRLFPDVPPDHPAMGAMIMNISANMLGLANAATPLGLKAMEELNKLNKKVGTATDAMCTFLVINTSNVQIIPATVIAIRAAAGASNPTDILGPVLVATSINTIVGITTVKLLAKLPLFRKQLEPEEAK